MSLSAWRGTLNVVYTLVWFLSYYHGVTSLPAALTSERVYLGYKNVFTELDLDMDKRISLLDLYCIPTKISHSSPARKCTFTRVTSVLLAQEAPIGLFYERVIKEYDINGDGVVNEMEYWSQVNEAIAETQQDASKFDQVHQLISKVEECLPQENTCTDLLRTEASLALYGLFDQDVMRCINQSPCSNVCQCFQSPEKTSLTTRMQRRDLDVGQHPHHLQKRFWPLIAWLAVIVSNLAPAVIAVALLVQVIIISQADLDGAVVNVLDIGPLPEGNQPPNCCYSYYWSQCDKLRSSNSRTCHRGGELADSNSCTSEKASGGAICKRPFIGTNHCQSLCVVKNTNGCSCTIFEYVVANKQRIVGDEMDRIKTDKKSECFSWCLERTTCQGINMYFDPESKEPINCQFLSSKTGFATEEKTVAYSKQSNGGYKSDKQKLAEAIADFLNNNSCRRSNVSLVARGVSEINRNYLTETFIAIYAAWTVAKSIPISMNDAVDQLNGLFLIVQQASINQVLLHVNDAQVGRGVDPRHTLNAILCNEESVTQNDRNEKDVRFLTTDMVQVGRGDSFVLAFEHYKCRGNNRYTSENVRAMIECRLWNLDRLLVDGGPSAAAENIISRVRGSKITVEGVEQQGYISHLIITHLDEDHIGGIARLLENNPTIFNPNTRVMIDDLFSPNNRASVGAPISAACDNINQAVATSQDINAFIQAADGQQTPAGTLTRAMLKVHWYLARSPTGFQVSGSLHDLRWIEPSGLDLSFIGPSLPVMGNALRSPLMCGRGIGDFYAEKSRARNALSVIFAVNYGPNGRMLFTGDATNESFELLHQQSFDVVKVAHHGSQITNTRDMIARFPATNYLISGASAGNILQPGLQTLKWITATKNGAVMWLTNWDDSDRNNLYCLEPLVDHSQNPYIASTVRPGRTGLRFVTEFGSVAVARAEDFESRLPRLDGGVLCPNPPILLNAMSYREEAGFNETIIENNQSAVDDSLTSTEHSDIFWRSFSDALARELLGDTTAMQPYQYILNR